MKQMPTTIHFVLTVAITLVLLSAGLPDLQARAATPVPSFPSQPTQEADAACSSDRTVQVSGTAVVNVAPDRALIQLGVQSNGKTPKEVQDKNTNAISRVTKALQKLGIEPKDITTDRYVIEPLYSDYDSLQIKGYRIYNIVAVTMRDVAKSSDAIAVALQAGANQVVNVEFYTSELRKYRDQAREMAVKAATEKAEALAQTAGAEMGCVLHINENTWSYFNGWSWWSGGQSRDLWTQNAVQNIAPAGGTTPSGDGEPVSTGMISIRAEVSATFAID